MSLCIRIYVCLYSTQLDSTQLNSTGSWKRSPFGFACEVFVIQTAKRDDERLMGEKGEVCGRAVGGKRPQPVRHFPEDLS